MQVCTKCVLPATYPAIRFDDAGVCNYCRSAAAVEKEPFDSFKSEDELIRSMQKFKTLKNKYDVLVPVSGGVDSCSVLIKIVETFNLTPLVFHNDHGYEEDTAAMNVRKLCKELGADLFLWQHDLGFMKKLWKYTLESRVQNLNACYVCGNILYLNAVEAAHIFHIPLIVNGYTKGMAPVLSDKESGREKFNLFMEEVISKGDKDFLTQFLKKNEWLKKQKMLSNKSDLEGEIDDKRTLVVPFYIFDFYKTDKAELEKICRQRFDWQPVKTTYPGRTTNCEINWINAYVDLKKMNYTFYHEEYSELIRVGEITRGQALQDLEFNPPGGLIERLKAELNIEPEAVNKGKKVAVNYRDDGEFCF